jgi:hypothetical protein
MKPLNSATSPVLGGVFMAFLQSARDAASSAVRRLLNQGITGGCSGWIVAGDGSGASGDGPCGNTPPPPHDVSEPARLGVFGLGVLLIGGFLGWRRRYS